MMSPLPWKQLKLILLLGGWGHLFKSQVPLTYVESGSYVKICHFAIFESTYVHALVHYSRFVCLSVFLCGCLSVTTLSVALFIFMLKSRYTMCVFVTLLHYK